MTFYYSIARISRDISLRRSGVDRVRYALVVQRVKVYLVEKNAGWDLVSYWLSYW